jgi:hypothetical protein
MVHTSPVATNASITKSAENKLLVGLLGLFIKYGKTKMRQLITIYADNMLVVPP